MVQFRDCDFNRVMRVRLCYGPHVSFVFRRFGSLKSIGESVKLARIGSDALITLTESLIADGVHRESAKNHGATRATALSAHAPVTTAVRVRI